MSSPYPGVKLDDIPAARYPYKKLDASKSQFRLFILYARTSRRPEDLRITIFEDVLDGDDRMVKGFQALSYVWGDATRRQDLMVIVPVEGAQVVCKLSVTASLAEALVHYPFCGGHTVLWADAICINQEDHEERAQQVPLMQRIYSKAGIVTAWLGLEGDDSNLAFNLLIRIGESVDVDLLAAGITKRDSSPWLTKSAADYWYTRLLLDHNFPIPWDGLEAQALEALFNRPWFERLWIRQEVTLGGERTVLSCGRSSITWPNFRKAAFVLAQKRVDDAHPHKALWTTRIYLVARIWLHRGIPLRGLMRDLRQTVCADPRDRVYGALGILTSNPLGVLLNIKPDYSKTVVQVYQDLLLADMKNNGRADLLAECFTSDSAAWTPSWVPNWSTPPGRTEPIRVSEACADGQSSVAVALCSDKTTLAIKGKLISTISQVWEPLLSPESVHYDLETLNRATVTAVKGCARKIDLCAEYLSGGNVLDALCFCLAGGLPTDHFTELLQQPKHESIAQYKSLVDFALSFTNSPAQIERLGVDTNIKGCMATAGITLRENMFTTAHGYMGFCPVAVRPGDQLCILLGCMKPMLLRPMKNSSSHYTVVGPCIVPGLNWGEGLLGPLPGDTKFVWNLSGPRGGCGPAFKNRYTGEEVIVDPRIDWDLLKVDNDKEDGFVSKFSLDGSGMVWFKRPDEEYFRKKGVELTVFNLV
jgi:hypothetical protein